MPLPDQILAQARAQKEEMVAFLCRLAAHETPSHEPAMQDPAFRLLAEHMEASGYACRRIRGSASGGLLVAAPRKPALRGPAFQLLLGHVDTVWPAGTLATMPVRRQDDRVEGPGVYDMKGGLTQLVFALRTLSRLSLQPEVTPVVLVNSDEEIGSGESTRHIARLARRCSRAYVLEPSLGPTGMLKTARKGVGRFTLRVQGKAAHAGLDPQGGVSAILELSHQVQQLFAMNHPGEGISLNVGKVEGGTGVNVVAPESSAEIDLRVPTLEAAVRMEERLRGLQPLHPGAQVRVDGALRRPPMERTPRNRRLWQMARETAAGLGLTLEETTAGGASDGNTASLYTATLDGLGAVGHGAHARHEFIRIEPMIERTALLALLLLAPHQPPPGEEPPAISEEF